MTACRARGDPAKAVLAEALAAPDGNAARDVVLAAEADGDELARALLAAGEERLSGDPQSALRALELAEAAATTVDSADVIPTAQYLQARLYLIDGQVERALDLIERARTGWMQLENPLAALRTELGRMHVLDDQGRHDEAAATAQRMLDELDADPTRPAAAAGTGGAARPDTADDRADGASSDGGTDGANRPDEAEEAQRTWLRGAAWENLGVACGYLGRFDQSLRATAKAELAYEQLGSRPDLARARANRGVSLVGTGNAIDGHRILEDAASMFDEEGDDLSHAQCLGHLADAEVLLGRYSHALHHYEAARTMLEGQPAGTEAARLQLRTIRAYLAVDLIDEAETLAAAVVTDLADSGLDHDLTEGQWLFGTAQLNAGRPTEAIAALDLAVDGAIEVGDQPLAVKALLARSDAELALDRPDEALATARSALELVATGDWPAEALQAHLQLAQLLGDDLTVRQTHVEAAAAIGDQLRLPHLRVPTLLALGRLRRDQGRGDEAATALESAVQLVEGLRGRIADESLRSGFFHRHTAAHHELAALALSGGPPEHGRAFQLVEASKARTLGDILAGVVEPGTVTDTEADLGAAYSALATGGRAMTAERRQAIRQRADELERAHRIADLRSAAGRSGPTATPTPEQAEATPGPDEQVVSYGLFDDRIVAFVWRHGQLQIVDDLGHPRAVAEQLARWDRQRQRYESSRHRIDPENERGLIRSAEAVLDELASTLTAPIEPLLDPGDRELLLVPHGLLHQVPFHALPGDGGRLGERWTTTVAPSYAVANAIGRRPRPETRGRSLVLGVPDDTTPAVVDEAEFVATTLTGAELYLGADATSRVLQTRSSQADVIHLACHGIHRARNPLYSALRLADRWFTAGEVLELQLDDSLVVLSACESGRQGGPWLGETIGLARSFLAAGARTVAVSLWLANDRATADLMLRFHHGVAQGFGPARAMADARRQLAQTHPHPADWAPFVLHGGPQGAL